MVEIEIRCDSYIKFNNTYVGTGIMSFPNKIQEIIFAHARYIYQNQGGLKGLDTIEATDKILKLIEFEIIGIEDVIKTEDPINREEARNELRSEQHLKLHAPKGETSKPDI